MVWGLVGMFIMASAFGIIQFIANTLTLDFKINNDGSITEAKQVIQNYGNANNPNKKQVPHAHQVYFSPDKKYVLGNDLGIDLKKKAEQILLNGLERGKK